MRVAREPDRATSGVAVVAASDPAATLPFDEIYELHFTFVWQNLRRLGVPHESVDDATQDVFVVVHRHLHEQGRYTSIRAWLCGISVRVASEYRRRRSRKEGKLEPLTLDVEDAAQPTPFDNAAQAQAARVFEELCARLPDDQRVVFILAEVEQMTARAIGEALNVNMHTVNSRLRAARIQFERLIAERDAAATASGGERKGEGR